MSDEQQAPHKQRKHRSPSYPAINLEQALERSQQLWNAAGRHPAPVSAAVEAFGYGPKSSGGRLALAALKKFGLVEDEGARTARTVKLTKLGSELIVYRGQQESEAWKAGARTAALKPKIHEELWEKYGGDLPADSVIKPYLILERDFGDVAAAELLAEFRATLAYAGLTDPTDSVSPQDEDENEDSKGDSADHMSPPALDDPPVADPPAEPRRTEKTVQVTYSPTAWALLKGSFPMAEKEWDAFLETLDGMKRGLVVFDDD